VDDEDSRGPGFKDSREMLKSDKRSTPPLLGMNANLKGKGVDFALFYPGGDRDFRVTNDLISYPLNPPKVDQSPSIPLYFKGGRGDFNP
jgi:hypothetical protein